jgi:hypothetical protein
MRWIIVFALLAAAGCRSADVVLVYRPTELQLVAHVEDH